MSQQDGPQRIEVRKTILGPRPVRARTVRPRAIGDYPRVPQVYRDVAEVYASPVLMGPPICDELMTLVQHLYTEEEAAAVRHLGILSWRTARQVARAERRGEEEIEPVLQRLAVEKRAIASSCSRPAWRYKLLPLLPGVFEMVLISESAETISPWHHRLAQLFEALYETGYLADYMRPGATPAVRYLPVGKAIAAHPMALPSDRLEVLLDRFDTFGVGQCQCRTSALAAGKGCDAPRQNCTVMGQWAERGIDAGWLKPVSRQNVLDIKREAESHGLVTWMMNVESTEGQCSCSCCGCCCKALRVVNEFNLPNTFAPPHFLPRFALDKCTRCGRCAAKCPMGAITVDVAAKTHAWRAERCIGCGLCAVACDRQQAVAMEPVADYKLPYRSWMSFLLRAAPGMARTAWTVWRQR
ncbi:MAG: 4Fe-4S binding protein [Thermoguttaceae bacterium]|nr:4Fe-4S binding protein [Thermoguttaceae bacterium]